MTYEPRETTNERIDRILADLREMVGWAQADAEHSRENGADEQATDDLIRRKQLEIVIARLDECRK